MARRRKIVPVISKKREHELNQLETAAKKLTGSKFTISGGHKGTKGQYGKMARDIAEQLGKATKVRKRNIADIKKRKDKK